MHQCVDHTRVEPTRCVGVKIVRAASHTAPAVCLLHWHPAMRGSIGSTISVLLGAALGLGALAYLARQPLLRRDDGGEACLPYSDSFRTRHMRRHRAHALRKELRDGKATDSLFAEVRCLLLLRIDGDLEEALQAAEEAVSVPGRRLRTAATEAVSVPGRRLGWRAEFDAGATSATRRVTRGLGAFAGADFPCRQRDAFVGAPWARNACLLKCSPASSGTAPQCQHAIKVCEKLSECATVDINVEGSVATLKQETELSRRTSRVKNVSVRHVRKGRSGRGKVMTQRGSDMACTNHEVELPELGGAPACVLNCPKLNCTAAIGQCFSTSSCIAVDIAFQVAGRDAVARLRFAST